MTATWLALPLGPFRPLRPLAALAICCLLALAVTGQPAAQAQQRASCGDIAVPDYPRAGMPGISWQDLIAMPVAWRRDAMEVCAAQASGLLPNARARLALARARAVDADPQALAPLRGFAEREQLAAARLALVEFYLRAPVIPLRSAAPEDLTRAEAEAHLRAAAESGDPGAQLRLGQLLATGRLVPQDRGAAGVAFARALEDSPEPHWRRAAAFQWAGTILDDPEASGEDIARLPDLVEFLEASPESVYAARYLRIRMLREGKAAESDPARAKALAADPRARSEVPSIAGEWVQLLADSDDPADRAALADLLETATPLTSTGFNGIVARMLMSGRPFGRDRNRGLAFLANAGLIAAEDAIAFSAAVADSAGMVPGAPALLKTLYEAAEFDVPGAQAGLLRLRASGRTQAHDRAEASFLISRWGIAGRGEGAAPDFMTLVLEMWFEEAGKVMPLPMGDTSGFLPYLERAAAKGEAWALRLRGKMRLAGRFLPQDTIEGEADILTAAHAGDVEAMLLAARFVPREAGTVAGPTARLEWIRRALAAGSIEAERDLVRTIAAHHLDASYDIAEPLAVAVMRYADGPDAGKLTANLPPMDIRSALSGVSNAEAAAAGLMEGFRRSLAARRDEIVAAIFRAADTRLTRTVEARLVETGHHAGPVTGTMGPAARAALIAWAREAALAPALAPTAIAPTAIDPVPDTPGHLRGAQPDSRLVGVPPIPPEKIARLREALVPHADSPESIAGDMVALSRVAALAQYGLTTERTAIVSLYPKHHSVRVAVHHGSAMLYAIDSFVTAFAGPAPGHARSGGAVAEAAELAILATELSRSGQMASVTGVVLLALRDDPRLSDRDTAGALFGVLRMVPGVCAAFQSDPLGSTVPGLEADGCSQASLSVLLDWAQATGPAGDEARLRSLAAEFLLRSEQD